MVLYGADSVLENNQVTLGPRTKTYCNYLVQCIKERMVDFLCKVYLGAGINPKFGDDKKSLAEVMHLEIAANFIWPPCRGKKLIPRISENKKAWGSIEETRAILDMLVIDGEVEPIVFSSKYHLWRVKLIWWILRKENAAFAVIKPTFVAIDTPFERWVWYEIGFLFLTIPDYFFNFRRFRSNRKLATV